MIAADRLLRAREATGTSNTSEAPSPTSRSISVPEQFLQHLPTATAICGPDARIVWLNKAAASCGLIVGDVLAHKLKIAPHGVLTLAAPNGLMTVRAEVVIDSAGATGTIYALEKAPDVSLDQSAATPSEVRGSDLRAGDFAMLDALPAALYLTDRDGRIIFHNAAAARLWGRAPDPHADRWTGALRVYAADGRSATEDLACAAVSSASPKVGSGVIERPDGSRLPFMQFCAPLHDRAGGVTGSLTLVVDDTERHRYESDHKVLLDEVNHRVQNALATVQSLALHTWRGHDDQAEPLRLFEGRLRALTHAHDALAREKWHCANLHELAQSVCAPVVGKRLAIVGEDVALPPRTAITLAMIFHELLANAESHGALVCPEGRVTLSWHTSGDGDERNLTIVWREICTNPPQPPRGVGFGIAMLERGIAQELGGHAQLNFSPTGLYGQMVVPLRD